jgi:hypothetical protein
MIAIVCSWLRGLFMTQSHALRASERVVSRFKNVVDDHLELSAERRQLFIAYERQ